MRQIASRHVLSEIFALVSPAGRFRLVVLVRIKTSPLLRLENAAMGLLKKEKIATVEDLKVVLEIDAAIPRHVNSQPALFVMNPLTTVVGIVNSPPPPRYVDRLSMRHVTLLKRVREILLPARRILMRPMARIVEM